MPSSPAPDRNTRRAAILLASLSPADATSNDAVGITGALQREGWNARLFSSSAHRGANVGTLSEAARFLDAEDGGRDALVVYVSGGRWDDGMAFLGEARGPVVLRDHNVTPPHFFESVSEEFVDAAAQGQRQRAEIAVDPRVARFLAASPRNADDLEALGAPRANIHVVPPFHPMDDLLRREPDGSCLRRWQRAPAATFVGRLSPNKGHRRLLRIARLYHEIFGALLPLRIVGATDPRLRRFTAQLDLDREHSSLRQVEFVGPASPAQLKSAYLTASVFLCASEHEGFCVPLVEAAFFGVPIVAACEDGVAFTIGDAGLIASDDETLAVAIHRVQHDSELRDTLVHRARRRCEQRFSAVALRAALREGLTGI